jgi:hypothetical protein
MAPDHLQVSRRKILLSPVAGGSDNRLVFPDHLFKVLDRLERNGILRFTEIDEGAGISAFLRQHHFDCSIAIERSRNAAGRLTA